MYRRPLSDVEKRRPFVSFSCQHSKILSLETNDLVELHCLHTFPSQSIASDILGIYYRKKVPLFKVDR